MTGLQVQFCPIQVTPITTWLFVSLSDGVHVGWGEATLDKQETAVSRCFQNLPERLSQSDLSQLGFATLPQAALSSGLRQAQADLEARQAGISLVQSLGGAARHQVALYANINRCSRDRSPEGMAKTARRALAAGHTAIKIAPFDEVQPTQNRAAMNAAMAPGLERIAAVRAAIGSRRLMVDCHWRFDMAGAEALIDACRGLDLYWIECPIHEAEATIPDLVALRRKANAIGIRLAGLETAILRAGFAPYLRAGAYDLMMPDVKYCGGPQEMQAIAADMARHGVTVSPHNPSGPICHMQSVHLCASLPDVDRLEVQFDETPLFDALVDRPIPQPMHGAIPAPSGGAGLGLSLRALDTGGPSC